MTRRTRLSSSIATGLAVAMLSACALLLLAWHHARLSTQTEVQSLAEQLAARANDTLVQADDALRRLEAHPAAPCSHQHLQYMQQIAWQRTMIRELSYLDGNDIVLCSLWGTTHGVALRPAPDFITPERLAVTLAVADYPGDPSQGMLVQRGLHALLIDPRHFVDTLAQPDTQLHLGTTDGLLVAVSAEAPTTPAPPDATWFSTTVTNGPWLAAVQQPAPSFSDFLRDKAYTVVPLVLLLAAGLFGACFYLLQRRHSPLAELRRALRQRAFVVHYHPIIDLRTGRCSGAEALLRWPRSDGSMHNPEEFITLAESSGLIKPLTDLLITQVMRDLGPTMAQDRSLHVALNLCADDIRTGRILAPLARAMTAAQVQASQVWLEVTERSILDIQAARQTFRRARVQGHVIAIDDFGTGYSNLQYIHGLPIDVLKIDRSFVHTIEAESGSACVISHIIDMAQSLDLFLVAEGVETLEQADFLAVRGVEFVQGWLYARPMPVDDFLAYYHHGVPPKPDGQRPPSAGRTHERPRPAAPARPSGRGLQPERS